MAGFGEPELSTVDALGLTLGIVATRWHGDLVDHMLDRAQAAAKACGVTDVVVVRVAGVGGAAGGGAGPGPALRRGGRARRRHPRRDGALRLRLPVGHRGADPGRPGRVDPGRARRAHRRHLEQARDRAGLPDSAEDKGWSATVAALDAAVALRTLDAKLSRSQH